MSVARLPIKKHPQTSQLADHTTWMSTARGSTIRTELTAIAEITGITVVTVVTVVAVITGIAEITGIAAIGVIAAITDITMLTGTMDINPTRRREVAHGSGQQCDGHDGRDDASECDGDRVGDIRRSSLLEELSNTPLDAVDDIVNQEYAEQQNKGG